MNYRFKCMVVVVVGSLAFLQAGTAEADDDQSLWQSLVDLYHQLTDAKTDKDSLKPNLKPDQVIKDVTKMQKAVVKASDECITIAKKIPGTSSDLGKTPDKAMVDGVKEDLIKAVGEGWLNSCMTPRRHRSKNPIHINVDTLNQTGIHLTNVDPITGQKLNESYIADLHLPLKTLSSDGTFYFGYLSYDMKIMSKSNGCNEDFACVGALS